MFLPIRILVITILYVYTKHTLAYKLIFTTSLISRILELGQMLKFRFEYSVYTYVYSTNIHGMMPQICYGIYNYVYNSVVQTLWLASADKTKKYSKRIRLVPVEPSTIYGGSNSSACSLKALICWQ